MAALVEVVDKRITDVSVRPAYFSDDVEPVLPEPGSAKFDEIKTLITALCDEVGTVLHWNRETATVDMDEGLSSDTRAVINKRTWTYPWLSRLRTETDL